MYYFIFEMFLIYFLYISGERALIFFYRSPIDFNVYIYFLNNLYVFFIYIFPEEKVRLYIYIYKFFVWFLLVMSLFIYKLFLCDIFSIKFNIFPNKRSGIMIPHYHPSSPASECHRPYKDLSSHIPTVSRSLVSL